MSKRELLADELQYLPHQDLDKLLAFPALAQAIAR